MNWLILIIAGLFETGFALHGALAVVRRLLGQSYA